MTKKVTKRSQFDVSLFLFHSDPRRRPSSIPTPYFPSSRRAVAQREPIWINAREINLYLTTHNLSFYIYKSLFCIWVVKYHFRRQILFAQLTNQLDWALLCLSTQRHVLRFNIICRQTCQHGPLIALQLLQSPIRHSLILSLGHRRRRYPVIWPLLDL